MRQSRTAGDSHENNAENINLTMGRKEKWVQNTFLWNADYLQEILKDISFIQPISTHAHNVTDTHWSRC